MKNEGINATNVITMMLHIEKNMSESNENFQKKKKYVPKRIQCAKCQKKFNKKETYETHVKTQHKKTTTYKQY